MKPWYELLFERYGQKYDRESFTQGTLGECDFIEKELGFNKQLRILDVGCGTGRHSIELTRRGYRVTGIDLSETMLQQAREKAAAANLEIDFQRYDARNLPFENEYEVVIMLCEGAFPLMETDEMNFQILQQVAKAIKNRGKFILTTLNGLFPMVHSVKEFCNEDHEEGLALTKESRFDPLTFRDHNITEVEDEKGRKLELNCNERYYIPPEINWMLKNLGFENIDIFGARLGAFSREHILTHEDFEMLVIAEKKG
jgi:2-polyprenyl-3-methyl-5-hydroxy-6-metoxy-1,4-benzoquinol methylase